MTMLEPPVSSSSDRAGAGGSEAPMIFVVVPVYKEEQNIRPFLARAVPEVERLGTYEIIFCLEPSKERTETIIREDSARNPRIDLLAFSRPFGTPAATQGGIHNLAGQRERVKDV